MTKFRCFGKKLQHLCTRSCIKLACFGKSFGCLLSSLYHYLIFRVDCFCFQLCYFVSVSFMGFLVLKSLKTRTEPFYKPSNLDIFLTSVSATTVSSMSTVEMEVFSNAQLVILTILMLVGAEVFTSMVGLHLVKSKYKIQDKLEANKVDSIALSDLHFSGHLELGILATNKSNPRVLIENEAMDIQNLKYNSIQYLGYVVLGYLVLAVVIGSTLVSLYMTFVPSAYEVLKTKGLHLQTYSVFVIVSTFANCGYVPTNENMVIFRNNSGLLLILIPQVLMGNTLFPACLRSVLWVLKKITNRDEFNYLLNNTKVGYSHLLPSKHSLLLVATSFGFIAVQFILYCGMEWNSEGLYGMNVYQKIVGVLFQTVNSRHAGENIADLSTVSPAILVLYVVMMYLPPYTSFLPKNSGEKTVERCGKKETKRGKLVENLLFSQLSYLVIFIILICITERNQIKNDPLNFTLLNITIEVISAYGNVGFTTGYSCKRQLNPDGQCKDMMYGFVGRWSNKGKLILILVMFFGRLKKFNMKGGRAWMLL